MVTIVNKFVRTAEIDSIWPLLGQIPVFLTGKAGTGKSRLLQEWLKEKRNHGAIIPVLAPTGTAAINVGGVTIHSFFGLHPGMTRDEIKSLNPRQDKREIWRLLQGLVIDEASMVRADMLDSIDEILSKFGPHQGEVFGGIPIFLVGDPYQLEPVVSKDDSVLMSGYDTPYFFGADIWKVSDFHCQELTVPFRQDPGIFLGILDKVRDGTVGTDGIRALNQLARLNQREAGDPILATLRKTVADYNRKGLDAIRSIPVTFQAVTKGSME